MGKWSMHASVRAFKFKSLKIYAAQGKHIEGSMGLTATAEQENSEGRWGSERLMGLTFFISSCQG